MIVMPEKFWFLLQFYYFIQCSVCHKNGYEPYLRIALPLKPSWVFAPQIDTGLWKGKRILIELFRLPVTLRAVVHSFHLLLVVRSSGRWMYSVMKFSRRIKTEMRYRYSRKSDRLFIFDLKQSTFTSNWVQRLIILLALFKKLTVCFHFL
jgi:hypothetical protein